MCDFGVGFIAAKEGMRRKWGTFSMNGPGKQQETERQNLKPRNGYWRP